MFYLSLERESDNLNLEERSPDVNICDRMGKNCGAITLQEYPLELQAKRYIELYKQVLQL